MSLADDLQGQFEPVRSPALSTLVAGLSSMFEEADDLTRDRDDRPGFAIALDPAEAPVKWIRFIGQFVGVKVPPMGEGTETEEEFRARAVELISRRDASRRGTVPYIILAVQSFLTGSKTVLYNERGVGGSAWHGNIATLASETPVPEATIQEEINRRKPGGTIIDFSILTGGDWQTLKDTHTDWADVKAQVATWAAVKADPSIT
jgi:hypothetical protein